MARLPNTKSIASMTLDLPLPFGPTTEENRCQNKRALVSPPTPERTPILPRHAAALVQHSLRSHACSTAKRHEMHSSTSTQSSQSSGARRAARAPCSAPRAAWRGPTPSNPGPGRRHHLVERANMLHTRVTLEVLERHVRDDEALIRLRRPARVRPAALRRRPGHVAKACQVQTTGRVFKMPRLSVNASKATA